MHGTAPTSTDGTCCSTSLLLFAFVAPCSLCAVLFCEACVELVCILRRQSSYAGVELMVFLIRAGTYAGGEVKSDGSVQQNGGGGGAGPAGEVCSPFSAHLFRLARRSTHAVLALLRSLLHIRRVPCPYRHFAADRCFLPAWCCCVCAAVQARWRPAGRRRAVRGRRNEWRHERLPRRCCSSPIVESSVSSVSASCCCCGSPLRSHRQREPACILPCLRRSLVLTPCFRLSTLTCVRCACCAGEPGYEGREGYDPQSPRGYDEFGQPIYSPRRCASLACA